jgi:hypothetical protein
MATMNRTFSVKTGIDVANTIVVDSSRNLSNVPTANVGTVNATSFVTVAGLDVTLQANTARGTANDAYAQANTARDTANDAYGQANTARNTANDAYAQANSGYAQANSARDQANTAYGQANAAYGQANAAYSQANAAYSQANTAANTVSVTVGGLTLNNKKLLIQNTSSMSIELLDDGTNANLIFRSSGGVAYDQANAAYAQANTARDTANDAYGQANTARTTGNNAYAQANTARDTANDAYGQANTARGVANDAYAQANAGYSQANAAYGQANAAYGQANAAYGEANLKLNLSGGTVSGDLTVQGNLFLTGNATYINVATLKVNDSIIQLSTNSTSDAVDIGFVGHYSEDGGTTNLHSGFIRHASDNVFYIFDGYATEPSNNVIDVASANLAWLRANVNAASLLLQGNTVATQANLTLAHDAANNASNTANGAYAQANGAYAQANGAFAQANGAYSQANGAYAQANGAYSQANGAYDQANTAANTVRVYANSASGLSNKFLNFINTASIQVSVTDNADGNANIAFITTGAAVADSYAQANAAYNQANAAYGQANTGYAQANAAYGQANAAYGQANLAYAQANAAYNTANSKVDTLIQLGAIQIGSGQTNNVWSYSINVNTASTTVVGVTKLVDSITSTDTANAATANSVKWINDVKVAKAGDTMTGKLTINVAGEGLEVANANVTNTLTVEALKVTTNTVTTAASGQVVLDIFPTTDLASAKYFVQANSGSTYHTTEIILVHEGTNIWITEYGTIQTGASLGTFNADIDSGNVRLLFNATQSINTIRAVRYGIVP